MRLGCSHKEKCSRDQLYLRGCEIENPGGPIAPAGVPLEISLPLARLSPCNQCDRVGRGSGVNHRQGQLRQSGAATAARRRVSKLLPQNRQQSECASRVLCGTNGEAGHFLNKWATFKKSELSMRSIAKKVGIAALAAVSLVGAILTSGDARGWGGHGGWGHGGVGHHGGFGWGDRR